MELADAEVLKLLMEHCAEADASKYATQSLYSACEAGNVEVVKTLILGGAKQGIIEHRKTIIMNGFYFSYDKSPINVAIKNSHFEMVKLLLEEGNLEVSIGALFFAISAANPIIDMVELLVKHAPDQVNSTGDGGWSALMLASYCGYEDIVGILLKHVTDINCQDEHKCFALAAAAGGRHPKVVQRLLNEGADVNLRGYGMLPALISIHPN